MEHILESPGPEAKGKTDQVYELIREFLPDIENELRKEITLELESSYKEKYQAMMEKTQEETRKQIDEIIAEIKNEALSSYNERIHALEQKEAELIQMKNEYKDLVEKEIKEELKAEFEKEKELILKTVIEEMNQEKQFEASEVRIKEKLQSEMSEELKRELARKEKLLNVNMKKKLDQEKKMLKENFEMEWKSKIEESRKELEREKNDISRLRSLENIRLKKLEEDKKNKKREIEEMRKKFEDTIRDLEEKIERLSKGQQSNFAAESFTTNNNSQERKGSVPRVSSKLSRENDDFEKKYIQNSIKKSPILDRTTFVLEGSFQRENWRKIEDYVEPLSPPKLLYFDEETMIGMDEEEGKTRGIRSESNQNYSEQKVVKPFLEETSAEIKKPERILIGEYNSKKIAEDIIRLYSEKKNEDISRLVSKSILSKPVALTLNAENYQSTQSEDKPFENLSKSQANEIDRSTSVIQTGALKDFNQSTNLKETNVNEKPSFLIDRERLRLEEKNKKNAEFNARYEEMLRGKIKGKREQERRFDEENREKDDGSKYKEIVRKFIKKSNDNNTKHQYALDENLKVNKYESLFLISKNDDQKVHRFIIFSIK